MRRVGRASLALCIVVLTSIVWASSAAHAIGETEPSPYITPPTGTFARWLPAHDLDPFEPDIFDQAVTGDVFAASMSGGSVCTNGTGHADVSYCGGGVPQMVCNQDAEPMVGTSFMIDHSVPVTYDFRCVWSLENCDGASCKPRDIYWAELHETSRHWLVFGCGLGVSTSTGAWIEATSNTLLYESYFWGGPHEVAVDTEDAVNVGSGAFAVRCTVPAVSTSSQSCDMNMSNGATWVSNSRDRLRSGCSSIYHARVSAFADDGDDYTFIANGTRTWGDSFAYVSSAGVGFCCQTMYRHTDGHNQLTGATGGWPAYYPSYSGTFSVHDGSGVPAGGQCGVSYAGIIGPDGLPVYEVDEWSGELGGSPTFRAPGVYTARITAGANTSRVGFSWTVNATGRGGVSSGYVSVPPGGDANGFVPVAESETVEWQFELLPSDVPGRVMTSFFAYNADGVACGALLLTGEPGNGAPPVGGIGEDFECFDDFTEGGLWGVITGALNPANYIKATECVFRWAFVPDEGWDQGVARLRASYEGSGVRSLQQLWEAPSDAVEQLAAGSGSACGGVDVPLAGEEFAFMDTCSGTGSEIRTVAVTVMRVGIYLAGALACWRIVARGFGVQTGGGDEA